MRQTLNINHLVPIGLLFVAALSANAGETLPNGIVLPDAWPPKVDVANKLRCAYLDPANIPNPIRIDTGRQLFVDDFLVESKEGVVRVQEAVEASCEIRSSGRRRPLSSRRTRA